MDTHTPLDFVKLITANYARNGFPLKHDEVVVAHRPYDKAQAQMCYNNAFKFLMEQVGGLGTWKYVLGYVFVHSVPIEHAWVMDPQGNHLDITLNPAEYQGYISLLELPTERILPFTFKHQYPPTLYDAAVADLRM